jgi:hypothetical protein
LFVSRFLAFFTVRSEPERHHNFSSNSHKKMMWIKNTGLENPPQPHLPSCGEVARPWREGWGLAWTAPPTIAGSYCPYQATGSTAYQCIPKPTMVRKVNKHISSSVAYMIGEFFFVHTLRNSCCGSNLGAPHTQTVDSPRNSFTAACRESRHWQPLSKARPDIKSPSCNLGRLTELATEVPGRRRPEDGWWCGCRPVASDRERIWVRTGNFPWNSGNASAVEIWTEFKFSDKSVPTFWHYFYNNLLTSRHLKVQVFSDSNPHWLSANPDTDLDPAFLLNALNVNV